MLVMRDAFAPDLLTAFNIMSLCSGDPEVFSGARLHFVELPAEATPALLDVVRAAVSPARRERLERFRRPMDILRGACGELLAREALAREVGVSPPVVEFGATDSGKPTANVPRAFNVAHSGRFVVCATGGTGVGVDVEEHRPQSPATARLVFTAAEMAEWEELGAAAREEYFYLRWTLKESFVKATGQGLAVPFERLQILTDGKVYTWVEAPWLVAREFVLAQGYTCSLCVTRPEPFPATAEPGGVCQLERRARVPSEAERTIGRAGSGVPFADRSRMGIRMPGG